jgi:hypothetical protein
LLAVQVVAQAIAIRRLVRIIPAREVRQFQELQVVQVRAVMHVQTQTMVVVAAVAVVEQMVVQAARPLMPITVIGNVRGTGVIEERILLLLEHRVSQIPLKLQTTVK